MPAGIGDAGVTALARLRKAETEVWATSEKILSEEQKQVLHGLIDAWIAENPDRTVVALVRFEEFADERKISSLSLRGKAHGLLKEVGQATAVVDNTRLLGERLLWFAGRFPYLIGEQTELTAYRLLDQPESAQFLDTMTSIRQLGETMNERIIDLENDLAAQQAAFFGKVTAERTAAITQLQRALQDTTRTSIDLAADAIKTQRTDALDQFFNRFSRERSLFLEDLESHHQALHALVTEIGQTVSLSAKLARDMTVTVNAIDRVVGRFDTDPEHRHEPIRLTEVRDAAIAAGQAAERTTHLLERFIALMESPGWDKRMSTMADPANAIVDRIFWRGVILILLLIAGIGLLRLVPQRAAGNKGA